MSLSPDERDKAQDARETALNALEQITNLLTDINDSFIAPVESCPHSADGCVPCERRRIQRMIIDGLASRYRH